MGFLRKFMYGRYGMDPFTFALIIFALIMLLLSRVLSVTVLAFVSIIAILYAYFRVFSKNISKRQSENIKFLSIVRPIQAAAKNMRLIVFGTKTHKYYKCPKCKQILRVPKGKGTIQITCNRCKNEFVKKT